MAGVSRRRPVDAQEPIPDEVVRILAQGLRDYFGRPVGIAGLRSRFLDTFSTHPISRLNLTLDSGDQLTVIFKRLQPRPDRDVRRRILIHRRLLADESLDAPTVYASVCDESKGRYWLFLEDVGQLGLNWCEDTEAWLAAYRWLARMHAVYYGQEGKLQRLGCLGEHRSAFYRYFARSAHEVLQRYAGQRRLVRFERMMGRYFDVSVTYLARHPPTLVHGDAYCSNFMVQPGPRIRPIDWDSAAIGVAGWDLAQLVAGWGQERPRFVAAYLDEFAQHAAVPLDARALDRTLAHCEIMRVLQVLYWWEGPYDNLAFVDRLLEEMESACRYLDSVARTDPL